MKQDGKLVRSGLIPGGKVGGSNEIISIKYFGLPGAICCSSCSGIVRSGKMFLSGDARLQEW